MLKPAAPRFLSVVLALLLLAAGGRSARAWGDEGHKVIAVVATAYLQPDVRRRVDAMLAADPDPLVPHDMPSAATWADHLRGANEGGARARTSKWHFADIEIYDPSLDEACFGHLPLPPGTLASTGPARSCVVDKIAQFTAELAHRTTPPDEQTVALKFLLHLVGDVHQPLHVADENDRGGNDKRVSAPGFRAGNLHHYWDTEFVALLGADPQASAQSLLRTITPAQARAWARGTAADWALESFALARDDAYGKLPPFNRRFTYRLTPEYIGMAVRDTRLQLSRAGVRLAYVLNGALGRR